MNSKTTEVYQHYKSLYGSALLLFRVLNNYEAYFDDAEIIAAILEQPAHTDTDNGLTIARITLPASEILDIAARICADGRECKMIQQRNEAGIFSLPDVKRLKIEQKIDY